MKVSFVCLFVTFISELSGFHTWHTWNQVQYVTVQYSKIVFYSLSHGRAGCWSKTFIETMIWNQRFACGSLYGDLRGLFFLSQHFFDCIFFFLFLVFNEFICVPSVMHEVPTFSQLSNKVEYHITLLQSSFFYLLYIDWLKSVSRDTCLNLKKQRGFCISCVFWAQTYLILFNL